MQKKKKIEDFCSLNCVPENLQGETLIAIVTVFGDGEFSQIIKMTLDHKIWRTGL